MHTPEHQSSSTGTGVATPQNPARPEDKEAEKPDVKLKAVRSKVGIGFVADKYGGVSFIDSQVAQVPEELAARMVAEDPDEYELA